MFWLILDGVIDGDWGPLFCVLLLVITLLAVGFLIDHFEQEGMFVWVLQQPCNGYWPRFPRYL